MLLVISWQLTIAVILAFPAYHFSLKWLFARIEKNSLRLMESVNNLSKKLFEILSGIILIKSYSQEEIENGNCRNLSEQFRKTEFEMDRKLNLISPVNEVTTLLVLLLLISVMSFLLIRAHIGSVGRFLVFFYLIRRVLNLTGAFNNLKGMLSNLRGPIKEIMWIFDDHEKYFVIGGNGEFDGLKMGIELKNLRFGYQKNVPVLKNLDLFIPQGKLTAVVGSSGAGKTTLINLIMRFYDCDPGAIFLDGEDIRGFSLKSLRRHMALVSQETFLFNDTLRYNITFGLSETVSEESLREAVRRAQLKDFIENLPDGFDTVVGDRGVKLSGGEKQRVAIARALLKRAEILVLDEATSSLDSKTEMLVQKAIDEAIHNRTSIVIAHRLSTIKHADQIIVIENGTLAEAGTLNELLTRKGKFYEYWEAQKFY
jgi:subfamily B ATP-binding cassette protein MsbA